MDRILNFIRNDNLRLFIKYLILFILLFMVIGSAALFNIINKESNPFFYANF